jgi:hypothetical protein
MTNHYHVHILCADCAEIHPLGVTIRLSDGPDKTHSLDQLYATRTPPAELSVFTNSKIRCLVTGKWTGPTDRKHVFLVPIDA